jgi:putative Holliday junction resolvase
MNTIEEFKNKITKKSRLLGLDLGSKRIGIAICDDRQSIATPFKTIIKEDTVKFIDELKLVIKENNIEGIIVGNPINMDGSLGPASQSVKDICTNINKNINVPLCLWDERLSTVGAFNLSNQLDVNVSKKVKNIDKNAAAFILQGAIDYLKN